MEPRGTESDREIEPETMESEGGGAGARVTKSEGGATEPRGTVSEGRAIGSKVNDKAERAELARETSLPWRVLPNRRLNNSDRKPRPSRNSRKSVAFASSSTEMIGKVI